MHGEDGLVKKNLPSHSSALSSFLQCSGDAEGCVSEAVTLSVLSLVSPSSLTSMIPSPPSSGSFSSSSSPSSSEEPGLRGGAVGITRSGLLENSSLRMWIGEMVTSQLVMPKSRRWARAWLDRPARVSKPALQNSQCITLNVSGSKLATVEGRRHRWEFRLNVEEDTWQL